MAPEYIRGNMWELLDNEYVTGEGGTIHGRKVVRVHEYPELGKLAIQSGTNRIEVDGLDFEAVVQKD